jgi:multidrug efflux pump subunit AcrA (membrane-fusion protein)
VELGQTYGNLVVVRSGVKPGDRVVTSGGSYVSNGERVRIVS